MSICGMLVMLAVVVLLVYLVSLVRSDIITIAALLYTCTVLLMFVFRLESIMGIGESACR